MASGFGNLSGWMRGSSMSSSSSYDHKQGNELWEGMSHAHKERGCWYSQVCKWVWINRSAQETGRHCSQLHGAVNGAVKAEGVSFGFLAEMEKLQSFPSHSSRIQTRANYLDSSSSECHYGSSEWRHPAPLLKVVQPAFGSPCLLQPSLHQCPVDAVSPHLVNTTLGTYSTRIPYRGVAEKLLPLPRWQLRWGSLRITN